MNFITNRTLTTIPTATLPPVTHAHQEGLRALVEQLQTAGQDVRLLVQLTENLPRLRAGLSAADLQRIEDLDANEVVITHAMAILQEAIARFDDIQSDANQLLLTPTMLLDMTLLTQIADAARAMAEAANDLALRAMERAGML